MDQEKIPPRPVSDLLRNREALRLRLGINEVNHTPPTPGEHYPHVYLWDSCFSAIIYARYGYVNESVSELDAVTKDQRFDGFIPNMQFMPKGRDWDLERRTFMNGRRASDYTQPPILALAVSETYKAFVARGEQEQAINFLDKFYPRLRLFYNYFVEDRQNSPSDPLIGNIHPHETGRDSDPIFDFAKFRLPRRGGETPKWIDEFNRASDYFSSVALGALHRSNQWKTEEVRKRFWVNDPMYNYMFADNSEVMADLAAELGYNVDAQKFRDLASTVEEQMQKRMWFADSIQGKGLFLALNGSPIEVASITNLFPTGLRNLSGDQLESQLDLQDACFNSPFVVPTVPPIDPFTMKANPNYDPRQSERDRTWRSTIKMSANWYLNRIYRQQAERWQDRRPDLAIRSSQWAGRIATQSKELVKGGLAESYNPETSEPLRVHRTKGQSWSSLAYIME